MQEGGKSRQDKLEKCKMEIAMNIPLIVIGAAIFICLIRCIRINHQQHEMIVERLGKYCKTWSPGIHVLIPVVDQVVLTASLKERIVNIEPQSVITKDNCTVMVDVVVFYRIVNSYQFCYGVDNCEYGISNLVATTLRNIIGELELDETLSGRQTLNAKMAEMIDVPTKPWGIQILRAEIKNIRPPLDVQSSMEKQLKAERDKRSAILNAEGAKQASILRAEGDKTAAILTAEGDKAAMVLRAEAYRQSKKLEAEGEAQAIVSIQSAKAQGIGYINDAAPQPATVKLQQLQAVERIASSPSSKTILPVEMKDLTILSGLACGVRTALEDGEEPEPGNHYVLRDGPYYEEVQP